MLVQCALVAKRYSKYLHNFYEHIKSRGGTVKAIIATARKRLDIILMPLNMDGYSKIL